MTIPVIFFAFKRLDTTQRVLAALQAQTVRPPLIIAFADGARHEGEAPDVEAVRALLRAIDWTDVQLIERERNYGGPANLIQGISQVFESYEQAVIVEDDVMPAPNFYEAMCLLLAHYAGSPSIFSVSGHPFLLPGALPDYPYDAIVAARFSIWGWATWADRWRSVKADLYDFRCPFASPQDVPLHAGADLPHTAHEASGKTGFYWTGSALALLTLHRDQWHVLTRDPLAINIGMRSGQHSNRNQHVIAFYERETLSDKIPRSLPPTEPRSDVVAAVQDYIGMLMEARRKSVQASQPVARRLKAALRRVLYKLFRR